MIVWSCLRPVRKFSKKHAANSVQDRSYFMELCISNIVICLPYTEYPAGLSVMPCLIADPNYYTCNVNKLCYLDSINVCNVLKWVKSQTRIFGPPPPLPPLTDWFCNKSEKNQCKFGIHEFWVNSGYTNFGPPPPSFLQKFRIDSEWPKTARNRIKIFCPLVTPPLDRARRQNFLLGSKPN